MLGCKNCDFRGVPNLEKVGPHTKASCPKCGEYIKFVPKKSPLLSHGTPFTLKEARLAASRMDSYPRDLIMWLISEVKRLEVYDYQASK